MGLGPDQPSGRPTMQSVHQGFKQLLAIVVTTSLIFSIVPPPTRAATEDVHPALAPRHLTGLSQSGYRKPQGTNSASLAKSSALENSPEVRELGPHHSGKKTVVPVAGSYPTKLGTRNSEAESVVKGSPVGDAKIRGAQPLTFIENKGQFDGRVKFQVTNREQTLWLTENGIVFDFLRNKPAQAKSSRPEEQPSREKPAIAGMVSNHRIEQPALPEIERHVVYQDFIGAKKMPIIETKNVQPGAYNYFVGTDPTKWRTDVRAFGEILYKDVWDGVDVKLYGSGPNVEQEFVVQPGADPTKVQVAYRGVDGLQVSEDGSLLIKTVFGELRESKPRIYQEIAGARVAVDGRFNLKSDNVYTFDVGTYSAEYPLVIDPTLLYSTFLGGSSTNTIVGMAVDTSGSTYVAGITASQDFPITSGTLQSGFNVFVTKLNASGSALVYSSILGRGFPVGFFSSGV